METNTVVDFQARCTQVAAIVEQTGATVAKAPRDVAIVVSRGSASVTFPIVSDARDWRATTPEEALFAALIDLYAWVKARPSDSAFGSLDATEKTGIPFVRRDLNDETERLRALAQIVGGMDVVRRAWQAAGIDADAVAAIE